MRDISSLLFQLGHLKLILLVRICSSVVCDSTQMYDNPLLQQLHFSGKYLYRTCVTVQLGIFQLND
jgi:hypothetical protein